MESLLHKDSSPINKTEHRDVDKESTNSNKNEAENLMRKENSPRSDIVHTPGNGNTVLYKHEGMHAAQKYLYKFRTAVRVVQVIRNLIKIYSFGPGRVVIRQGHVPQNFYLILSGTAVVSKVSANKETGELYSKTVAFLKRGKCFGDVAILTSNRRNATVTCHDTVSLLAVSREDFLNIFMNSESQEGPEYMKLLRKIEVLSGWPIEKLPYNNPRICAHIYFRPGTVITKDSKASSKIYVIKTGTASVLKVMTSPKPRNSFKYSQLMKQYNEFLNSEESRTGFPSKEHGNDDQKNVSSSFHEEEDLLPILQQHKKSIEQEPTVSRHHNGAKATNTSASTKILEDGEVFQMYIHIQTLRVGDVFGLVYAVFEDTLSMALVSEGAECILISKEFFRKHMDEDYFYKLSTTVQPYPSKEILQSKMQEYINWKAYRSHLINKTY